MTQRRKGDSKLVHIGDVGRAVEKGLHWAGRQVPLIGDADAKPHAASAVNSVASISSSMVAPLVLSSPLAQLLTDPQLLPNSCRAPPREA